MYKIDSKSLSRARYNLASFAVDRVKFGDKGSVPINQGPSKDFNIDPHTGRPMQQITALLHAQSAAEQMALFSGLEEFKSNYLPDDISNEDAIRFMMPRYCQLPHQISEFSANLAAEEQAKKLEKAKKDEDTKKVEEPTKVDAPAVAAGSVESAPSGAPTA